MMPSAVYKDTMFFKFLGQLIVLTPLGQGFNSFFPCFLLLPVLATLFNLYGKTKNLFGFGILEDESEDNASGFGTGGWREGKALIDRELQSRGADGTVGLPSRGASLDLERGASAAAAPSTSTAAPPRPASGVSNRPMPAFRDEGVRQANRNFNSITNHEEQEDDSARHFYQDFGERIKNTIDTTDTPEWMRNIGGAFKTPKWMQNSQQDESGASALSKWFGGRAEDGRVRL